MTGSTTTQAAMTSEEVTKVKDNAELLTRAIEHDWRENETSAHSTDYWMRCAVEQSRVIPKLVAEIERARAAVERVRALHAKRDVFEVGPDGTLGAWRSSGCEACSDPDLIADLEAGELTEDLAPWPCDTIDALDSVKAAV